jgi:hypothetical protein
MDAIEEEEDRRIWIKYCVFLFQFISYLIWGCTAKKSLKQQERTSCMISSDPPHQ